MTRALEVRRVSPQTEPAAAAAIAASAISTRVGKGLPPVRIAGGQGSEARGVRANALARGHGDPSSNRSAEALAQLLVRPECSELGCAFRDAEDLPNLREAEPFEPMEVNDDALRLLSSGAYTHRLIRWLRGVLRERSLRRMGRRGGHPKRDSNLP